MASEWRPTLRPGRLSGMLHAIRVRTRVDSDVLKIPELLPLVGRSVEVIIVEDEPGPAEGASPRKPQLGTLRGLVDIPDDFDAPLPEDILRTFEGEP
jgi:hypothetical protein